MPRCLEARSRGEVRVGTPLQSVGWAGRDRHQSAPGVLPRLHPDALRVAVGEREIEALLVTQASGAGAVREPAEDIVHRDRVAWIVIGVAKGHAVGWSGDRREWPPRTKSTALRVLGLGGRQPKASIADEAVVVAVAQTPGSERI